VFSLIYLSYIYSYLFPTRRSSDLIYIKRIIDFMLSLVALIILSPLFLVLALWIKFDSKGPVFFKQKRIGKDRIFFQIYKFRTMRSEEHTSELQSRFDLVCRLLFEK